MKLVNTNLGVQISFHECIPTILAIENPLIMTRFIWTMMKQINGGEGDFILSDEKELKFEKSCGLILDPFSLELNSKKVLTVLYKKLGTSGGSQLEGKSKLLQDCISLIDQCIVSSGIENLTYDADIAWNDIFKALGVRFDDHCESLLDKVISYLKILSDLSDTRVLVLLNFTGFFSTKELEEIVKMGSYLKINLVFLEKVEPATYLKEEARYIIDKDQCVITNHSF